MLRHSIITILEHTTEDKHESILHVSVILIFPFSCEIFYNWKVLRSVKVQSLQRQKTRGMKAPIATNIGNMEEL